MIDGSKKEKVYFAASNTGAGFINYFDRIFAGDDRIYILKGGPGTGKSYFLKQIAARAREMGLECESYLCSSDADSLDGVRIPALGIAVFDGTPPHAAEPKLPGVKEDILNLGSFWKAERLREHAETVKALSEQKGDYYASALSMLQLAAQCMRYRLNLLEPYVKRERMDRCAMRLLKKLRADEGAAIPRPMRSYGMKGERKLQTFSQQAVTVRTVSPLYGIEYLYLQLILQRAMAMGMAVEYAPHPLMPDLPEALYFAKDRVLLSAMADDKGKTVGSRRFLDSKVLGQRGALLRFLGKGMQTMTEAALEEFEKMRVCHFELERIYGSAMDFGAKERFVQAFLEDVFQEEKMQ